MMKVTIRLLASPSAPSRWAAACQRHGVPAASAQFIKKPFAMDALMVKMRETPTSR